MKGDEGIKRSFVDIVKEEEAEWIKKTNVKASKESNKGAARREIRTEVIEEMEREKRRSNIVLMGVPEEGEQGEGEEIVRDVVRGLVPEATVEFVVVGRIGKKGEGNRPVRVRVEDQGHRRKLLSRAKELKGKENLQRIYLVPDLTKMQQLEDKALRDEVKSRRLRGEIGVKIEKGVVVSKGTTRVEGGERQEEGHSSGGK